MGTFKCTPSYELNSLKFQAIDTRHFLQIQPSLYFYDHFHYIKTQVHIVKQYETKLNTLLCY